jgi:CO dehydrogenase/acetyl-CoA synthase beta subunit
MTLGVVTDVSAPVATYDALHAAVLERTGTAVDGLLLHLARPTADGFQLIEVWESGEQWERAHREVIGPVVAEVLRGQAPPAQVVTEFEVRGLVLPRAGVAV